MKTQTAVEWLMNNLIERKLVKDEPPIKSFLNASLKQAKQKESDINTAQIELLRERLVKDLWVYGLEKSINIVFNEFLKEINDGK
jgi:hypothetical protein